MIVLDTNVVSELMGKNADAGVVAWVDQHPEDESYLTAITTAELLYGVARLPEGRRKREFANGAQRVIEEDFTGRVLPFDNEAASHYAQIVADRERRGEPISMADAQIAAICRSCDAGLATRNIKDFVHTGVRTINPWDVSG